MSLLPREKDSNKGQNGEVAVLAGSKDFTGAPALVAMAALRTGCDLVKIITSEEISSTVASYSPNFIVREYSGGFFGPEGVEEALKILNKSDAAVVGPGLGDADEEAIEKIVQRLEIPAVIDADAIEPAVKTDVSGTIFTPHSGEKKAIEAEFGSFEDFVEETGNVVVKTSSADRIYTEDGVRENSTGHPGMTVGGTGDVLAGVAASLLAQGMDRSKAALKAAEINGKAGENAAEEYGKALLATDVIEKLPEQLERV